MSTKIKLFLLGIIFLLSSYLIYNFVGEVEYNSGNIIEKFSKDEMKFKEEYESINNKVNESTGNKYLNINIIEDNNIKYVDVLEVIDILENKTGIIYFGYKECPWCRNAIPVLLDVASNFGVKEVYYYNPYEIRDSLKLDLAGNIVTEKEGTVEYYKILSLLGDKAADYEGINQDKKRLYVPTVVFVKEGIITMVHTSTVDSQIDPSVALNSNQIKELEKIYEEGIASVYGSECQEEC